MSTGRATIDLGVYGYRAGPEGEPGHGRSPSIWALIVRRRRWFAVVLLVVLLGPLAGAAAPPEPQLVRLWTVPGGPRDYPGGPRDYPFPAAVAVDGGRLYTVLGTAGSPVLAAYTVEDGSVLWEVPLDLPYGPDQPGFAGMQVVDGVVLVFTYQPAEVAAYDPETGQPLWTGEGLLRTVQHGLVMLGWEPSVDDPDERPATDLVVRDLASGAVVVSMERVADPFDTWQARGGALHLLTLADDGVLNSHDLAAGTVAHTAATPYPEPSTQDLSLGIRVAADVVTVSDWENAEVVAYDAGTLEHLWTLDGFTGPRSCGPVICVVSGSAVDGSAGGLRAVDPDTGAFQWSMDCADGGVSERCDLYATELGPGDRLLIYLDLLDPRPGEPARRYWVVDAVTGRQLTEPTVWGVLPQPDSGMLLRLETGVRAAEAEVEYSREGDVEPHRVWWARSDMDLDRIEVLGAVEADRCTPHDPYLVCHTAGEPAEVWRIGS